MTHNKTKKSVNTYISSNAPISKVNYTVVLKADSGATNHYFKKEDMTILNKVKKITHTKTVQLPNSTNIPVTHQGLLPLSNELSDAAKTVQILPKLTNCSLLSIGQLCDDNCWGLFNKKDLLIFKKKKLILRGKRNHNDGLWDVHMTSKYKSSSDHSCTKSKINVITKLNQSTYELANFYHACLFSPTIRTLQDAIHNNHLVTWPSINKINFKKCIQDTTAIEMGHMKRERQNLQSTKIESPPPTPNTTSSTRTYQSISTVIPFTPKEMTYGDLTGA